MITVGLKEETIIKIIEECIKPLSGLKNGFEKQENRADEIAEDLPPEKYPSVSAVIAFVKNKIEVFSEAVGKVYLKATDFEDYKTDASNTYVTKTDVENFENNVADTYATKTDVENFENNVADTYATKTDVEDFENNVADTYATKTDVEDFENNVADTYATKNDVEDLKTDTEVTATATGKAISIFPAGAPIPQLILRGETTQDGTPTQTEPKELNSVGDSGSFEVGVYSRNVIDITIDNLNWNGVPITNNGDGSVTINGTSNNTWTKYVLGSAYLPAGTYKAINYGSYDTAYLMVVKPTDTVNAYLDCYAGGTAPKEFTLTEGKQVDFLLTVVPETTLNNVTFRPMVMRAEITDETFEPCKKQYITMPYELRSVRYDTGILVRDEIDLTKGINIEKTVKYTFNGSENWQVHANGFILFNPQDLTVLPHYCLCDKYTQVWWNDLTSCDYGIFASDSYSCFICVKDKDCSTVEEFKSKLASNPITVIGIRATPIETPLTETELNAYRQLYTNKGNTTILSEADMEVDYYINKPNAQAIGNIHTQINKDYLKLQQAIISTGGN